MPIRAVACDIDGTLYPNLRMYIRSVPFFLRHYRLVREYARIRKHVRTRRPVENLKALERELLAEALHVDTAAADRMIDRCIHGTWESVFGRVKPYRHVRESLTEIRDGGVRLAASSDFPVERKLSLLGLDDLFHCSLWSEESGYLKPHPEPFMALAECIGEAPENILYVGNSYEYDIVGAKSAGMLAAHLRRRPVRDTVADVTFADYRQLAGWVAGRNRE
jgi:putative hydrolase of the HAD superfamily